MPDAKDILSKALALEAKQGYMNKAIQGGLQAFAQRWVPSLGLQPAVLKAMERGFLDYSSLLPQARKKAVEDFQSVLAGTPLPGAKMPTLSKKSADASMPQKKALPKPPLSLSTQIKDIAGIGPKRAQALAKLGLSQVEDLLHYYPRAWEDRSRIMPIGQLKEGDRVSVIATVRGASTFRVRGGMTLTEVAVQDAQGAVLSAMYFNQPYQQKRFPQGAKVVLSGKVERRGLALQLMNPEAEVLPEGEEALVHTGRIVPLYPLNKTLNQRAMRNAVFQALPSARGLADPLPESIRTALKLESLFPSLQQIHFPESEASRDQARRRLAFDELFFIALGMGLRKAKAQAQRAYAMPQGDPASGQVLSHLPFQLTRAQARVWHEIEQDLQQPRPMHRLIQGDVGCGKTLLAALALARACGHGYQAALMAPTEILADQHLSTLRRMLGPAGIEVRRLIQGQKSAERREVLDHLASGRPMVCVGTQALIQDGVEFGRLGLAVVDEQHRFGVMQRLRLAQKAKEKPHMLVMTATPIPRTLAMTVYGDLDVSIVDELPPGRQPIATHWLPPAARQMAWDKASQELDQGRQVYVVYALVDESDKIELQSATAAVEALACQAFKGARIGLLHGRMKPEEKDAVMEAFKSGAIQVLASTTVVEVGVDVPNATVMIIEDADRFGLAQLHQLRGRVGRGAVASHCFLIGAPNTEEGRARLSILQESSDGFRLAEEDLRLRGPGEFLGVRQSGIPDLKLADLLKDQKMLLEAKRQAGLVLSADPILAQPCHAGLLKAVSARFEARLELGEVG
jgi:ATP-dependent DNA helicase RecG